MIVSCRSCQTRFRIADEKIKERGVKVRCSRCGEVFLVRRDDEPLNAAAADVPWGSPPSPGRPAMPAGDELSVHDGPTRVGEVPAGVLGLSADFTPARPAPVPPPSAPAPASDPFADLDPFGDVLPPRTAPPPPQEPPPPLATAQPSLADEDPFAGLDLGFPAPPSPPMAPPPPPAPLQAGPPPLPTQPRPGPSLPPPPEPPPEDDPFAGLDTPAPAQAPDPFGLMDGGDLPPIGKSLDIDLAMSSPTPGPAAAASIPAPVETSSKQAVARIGAEPPAARSRPAEAPRREGRLGASLSVAAGVVLLLGILLGLVALRGGGLGELQLDTVFEALGLSPPGNGAPAELSARDVLATPYPTAAGRPMLVVSGRIESRSGAGPAVRVAAELVGDGGRVLARSETWAGRAPSLEAIASLRSAADWQELVHGLAASAASIPARGSAPFVAVFPDAPDRLESARVRVVAQKAEVPATPEPVLPPPTTPIAAEPAAR